MSKCRLLGAGGGGGGGGGGGAAKAKALKVLLTGAANALTPSDAGSAGIS